jgi:hypothetical protein
VHPAHFGRAVYMRGAARVVLLADAMVVPARTLGDAESAGQGTVRTACIHAAANENVTRLCLYGARCTMARGARRR